MSENTNPLTDFIDSVDGGSSVFDDLPFPDESKTVAEQPQAEGTKPEEKAEPAQAEITPEAPAQTAFDAAVLKTTAAVENGDDPFAAALEKAKAQSEKRLVDGIAQKEAIFSYGTAKDAIKDIGVDTRKNTVNYIV